MKTTISSVVQKSNQAVAFYALLFEKTPMSDLETQIPAVKTGNSAQVEVKMVKCDSCGFTEDCTPEYIMQIRDKYNGRWICGLCVEAVKDEVLRSDGNISTEEALERHSTFCLNFQSSSPPSSTLEHPIFAIGRILRRSLDSPNGLQSTPTSPVRPPSLLRSESCFPSLSS